MDRSKLEPLAEQVANAIAENSAAHGYEGAFAGQLNFFLSRLLNHLPRSLVTKQGFPTEMRYWVQPLMYGVLLDVALEHKRRVNTAYEADQIVKNGDCFDTPYYTRLIEVIDEDGKHIGWQEVMLKRSEATLGKDVIGKLVLRKSE